MESKATSVFAGTHVNITSEGHRHLGAVIVSRGFCEEYVRTKVISWCEDLAHLATIALSHPQAVYSIFTRCMMNRWSFLTRTVPDLQTLEESTHRVSIPALTNRPPCSLIERKI